MLSKRFASLVLCLGTGLVFLVSGCGGGGSGPGAKDPVVMYLNACQDGSVAFFANDTNESGTLAYRAKTKFKSIPFIDQAQGGYDLSVEEPNRSVVYDNQATIFQKDSSTIVAAVGVKNPLGTEQLKRLKLSLFNPDRTQPIGNRARIIFFHGFNRKSPFGTPQLVLQTVGDQPLFQSPDNDYGKFVALEVDSGTYKFYGTGDVRNDYFIAKDPDNDQIYGLPPVDGAGNPKPVTLKAGGIYVVMLSGVENANGKPSELSFLEIEPDAP